MASYDNSRYTYAQVLSGTGYYKQDSNLKYRSDFRTLYLLIVIDGMKP